MSVKDTLEVAMRDYMKEHEDSANSKPNKILLSPKTYENYKDELNLSDRDNVTLTLEQVQVVKNEGQSEPIILEKRNIHR